MEENQNVVNEQQPQEPQPQPQPEAQQQYNQQQQWQQPYGQQPVHESKVGIGVVCALFLGLIGLLIGYLLYKNDKPNMEYEWKTFLKGWIWTFCICVGVGIISAVVWFVLYGASLAMWAGGIGGGFGF